MGDRPSQCLTVKHRLVQEGAAVRSFHKAGRIPIYAPAECHVAAIKAATAPASWHLCGTYVFSDHTVSVIRDRCHRFYHFDPGKEFTFDAAVQLALRNAYDPVVNYLNALVWDRVSRIDSWLYDYMGAAPTELNKQIGRLMLIALVRRAKVPTVRISIRLSGYGASCTSMSPTINATQLALNSPTRRSVSCVKRFRYRIIVRSALTMLQARQASARPADARPPRAWRRALPFFLQEAHEVRLRPASDRLRVSISRWRKFAGAPQRHGLKPIKCKEYWADVKNAIARYVS
jgi:hypothetical protein